MICGNLQLSIEHKKSQNLHLNPEKWKSPWVRFSCFLDQLISPFSDRNHSAEFVGLKLSTVLPTAWHLPWLWRQRQVAGGSERVTRTLPRLALRLNCRAAETRCIHLSRHNVGHYRQVRWWGRCASALILSFARVWAVDDAGVAFGCQTVPEMRG
jgi:hypothetical protein